MSSLLLFAKGRVWIGSTYISLWGVGSCIIAEIVLEADRECGPITRGAQCISKKKIYKFAEYMEV